MNDPESVNQKSYGFDFDEDFGFGSERATYRTASLLKRYPIPLHIVVPATTYLSTTS